MGVVSKMDVKHRAVMRLENPPFRLWLCCEAIIREVSVATVGIGFVKHYA